MNIEKLRLLSNVSDADAIVLTVGKRPSGESQYMVGRCLL